MVKYDNVLSAKKDQSQRFISQYNDGVINNINFTGK